VERLLTPAEVAELFRVNSLTVTRWAVQGRIGSVRTLGGHTWYKVAEVLRLAQEALRSRDRRARFRGGAQRTQMSGSSDRLISSVRARCMELSCTLALMRTQQFGFRTKVAVR
jgi:excisionase family DNA binding protein